MAIVAPEIRLNSSEKELLTLLADLVVVPSELNRSNLGSDQVCLSDRDADRLMELLTLLIESPRFQEGAYFVERLSQVEEAGDDLREIYLSWRKRLGRSRVMASRQWSDFLLRLGFIRTKYRNSVGPAGMPNEMDLEHFIKMEASLLSQNGISPRVKNLVLGVISKYAKDLDDVRHGETPLPKDSIRSVPARLLADLKSCQISQMGLAPLPTSQVAGLMTIVTDMSVLFSTRDWSVTGTLSTMAGGLASATYSHEE